MTNTTRLLVVDDEQAIAWGLAKMGTSLGYQVDTAATAERGLELAQQHPPDVMVLDVRLPGIDGLSAIERFRAIAARVPIIVVTAHGDLQTAVKAVQEGAFDYITKPFNLEQVREAVLRAVRSHPPAGDVVPSDSQSNDSRTNSQTAGNFGERLSSSTGVLQATTAGFIGHTPVMQATFNRIALAAAADSCVLLGGESGTGKELAARAIHHYSRRSSGPFVAVNVAALSESLAESELFGHERGAFTGAERARAGLLVQANGGTLFLDEVADIPLAIQIKLLRALDTGEVLPVGGDKPVASSFRLISASHQDLLQKVQAGTFRHDLFYRLAAFRIDMPPLRERLDDIPDLVRHFAARAIAGNASNQPKFTEEAMAELRSRPWHGNIRELRNVVEHALIVARGGAVLPEHLAAPYLIANPQESIVRQVERWAAREVNNPAAAGHLHEELLKLVEPPLLRAAVDHHAGNCAAAARDLGLHRVTLRKKLDEYGIS
ncbi:MAG: sigma-54-dependent transcriptional regulator [Planctomycetota bacterium]